MRRRERCHCLAGRTSWTLGDPSARAAWRAVFEVFHDTGARAAARAAGNSELKKSVRLKKENNFILFYILFSLFCRHICFGMCERTDAAMWKHKATPRGIRCKWMNNELTSDTARSQTSSCAHRRGGADRSAGTRYMISDAGIRVRSRNIFFCVWIFVCRRVK